MDKDQILKDIVKVIHNVLDKDDIVITRDTVADEVEDWDSLNHIHIIVSIENHFNIKFTSSEIINFKNVGEMCDSIFQKLQR